jgi:hypothetical protein
MSSTITTKGKGRAPAAASDQEDTIAPENQPPQTRTAKSKGKNVVRSPRAESSTAAPTIPSSSRAIDDAPAAQLAVENQRNNQLRNEGIPRLPENLEAAQQEITALKATIQRLRQPATSKNQKSRNARST